MATETRLTLSLDPDVLHRFVLSNPTLKNYAYDLNYQVPITVPAATGATPGTYDLAFTLPNGYAAALSSPAEGYSETVAADIAVGVTIDGVSIIGQVGLYLGQSVRINGQWKFSISTGIVMTFSNSTPASVDVYVAASVIFIIMGWLQSTYLPLLESGWTEILKGAGLS